MEGDEGLCECHTDRQKERVPTLMLTEKERDKTKEKYEHETLLHTSTVRLKEPEEERTEGKIKWSKSMAQS